MGKLTDNPPVPATILVSEPEENVMAQPEICGHFPAVPQEYATELSVQAPWLPFEEKSRSFPSLPAPQDHETHTVCISQYPMSAESIVAVQEAVLPPLAPAQLQVQGPIPDTADAVPEEQRDAVGAQGWAEAEVPHAQFTTGAQAEPFHAYPETHANVHCPGVAEYCQVPVTDCEVALEVPFAGTVDWHTSDMHVKPEGT